MNLTDGLPGISIRYMPMNKWMMKKTHSMGLPSAARSGNLSFIPRVSTGQTVLLPSFFVILNILVNEIMI